VRERGVQVVVVVGGGNIFRGKLAEIWNIDRAEADNVGIVGTVVNSLVLRGALRSRSAHEVRVMTSTHMDAIAEPYIRLRAMHHLDKGFIIILAGGNGQPFVTTDYPAVQRAIELECDAIFAAKDGVDGVYTSDPKVDKEARLYRCLKYEDVVAKDLRVMDQSAFILARDFRKPIHVFNFNTRGAMAHILEGRELGTKISDEKPTVLA
jgi:uridylate kinase